MRIAAEGLYQLNYWPDIGAIKTFIRCTYRRTQHGPLDQESPDLTIQSYCGVAAGKSKAAHIFTVLMQFSNSLAVEFSILSNRYNQFEISVMDVYRLSYDVSDISFVLREFPRIANNTSISLRQHIIALRLPGSSPPTPRRKDYTGRGNAPI